MSNYINPKDRKTILFIGDDLRASSGVGVMSRAIVYRTAEHFNWIQIGVLMNRDKKDILNPVDISSQVNAEMGYHDSSVIILPDVITNNQYSNITSLRQVIRRYKIDAILFFTDPRYYEWLFKNEMEIRKQVPLIYLNIWDNLPYPLWNKPFYDACDGLFAISKQTFNINTQIVQDAIDKKVIKYIPHGIENTYYPIPSQSTKLLEFKRKIFGDNIPNFILLFNARNMGRKNMSDLVLAWKLFTDTLSFEEASQCCLLFHCNPVDWNGTDIDAIWRDNCDTTRCKIKFIPVNLPFKEMNLMYNISDGVILPSYAEGWGLSVTEAMTTGKMFIATVTGGMQDQMRFTDENGEWINFSKGFPTNSVGKYKDHGRWCIPIWPCTARSMGSPKTPYIYEDCITIEDMSKAIGELYSLTPSEREERGREGMEWAASDEAGFTAKIMGDRVVDGIEEVMNKFTPAPNFRLKKIDKDNLKEINRDIIWVKYKN